ncbi:hypothetical protein [Endozoicomonas acroporae]|nr:hypothetical protein [Endozoicomonas acroporae]
MMNFVFREPDFPLLIESDDKLLSAFNLEELIQKVRDYDFKLKNTYTVIDSKGEGWTYIHDIDAISPLTIKKRWYKKEIIELCNQFISDDSLKFIGRSLSSKTLPKLITEILEFSANS